MCHSDGLLPVLASLVAILGYDPGVEILLQFVVARPHTLPVVSPQNLRMQSSQLQCHFLVDGKLVNLVGEEVGKIFTV